jgi:hypothetical protein
MLKENKKEGTVCHCWYRDKQTHLNVQAAGVALGRRLS